MNGPGRADDPTGRPTSAGWEGSPLTLTRVMVAIGVLACGFATLPIPMSVALAVAILGVLAVDGLRLPQVTGGTGPWRWVPWVVWWLALIACPLATAVLGIAFERAVPPPPGSPEPWAARAVEGLRDAHVIVSVVAWVAVGVLARGRRRWLAWAAVLAVGVVAGFIGLDAAMATSGVYL